MKCAATSIRNHLAAGFIAFASTVSIATAKFEQDQQSCGMMMVELKGKRNESDKKTDD
ncbi:hypothetical protein [Dyadobacter diqingensis]|uniref:hypothetical protein n=1 Tax=Dyadobacter diqingensis TaxID=2938121 RepID=UPI0020C1909F|nr:hypothetical protein [Dyadobacter diqingensis]